VDIRSQLDLGLTALRDAIDDCPEEICSLRPAPDRWSIVECIEHLARAEAYLGASLNKGRAVAPVVNAKREGRIVAAGEDRTRRIEAPDLSHPTGSYASVAAAMEALEAARAATLAFLDAHENDLHGWEAMHPLIGPVNAYEMLLVIAMHPRRHVQQIRESRAALQQAG
jgi:hypothetical protein